MKKLEVVVRRIPREITYFRRRDASLENAGKYRLASMLQFAKLSHSNYGKPYEERIENIRKGMKKVAIKEKVIELSKEDLVKIKLAMLKKGITRLSLPENYKIKIKGVEEKEEERLKKLVFI
ncbi:MAG: hypothetical protein QXI58_06745 [Candidatus Micrarchaeia archaeon]